MPRNSHVQHFRPHASSVPGLTLQELTLKLDGKLIKKCLEVCDQQLSGTKVRPGHPRPRHDSRRTAPRPRREAQPAKCDPRAAVGCAQADCVDRLISFLTSPGGSGKRSLQEKVGQKRARAEKKRAKAEKVTAPPSATPSYDLGDRCTRSRR